VDNTDGFSGRPGETLDGGATGGNLIGISIGAVGIEGATEGYPDGGYLDGTPISAPFRAVIVGAAEIRVIGPDGGLPPSRNPSQSKPSSGNPRGLRPHTKLLVDVMPLIFSDR
jgi:hypothetical protein